MTWPSEPRIRLAVALLATVVALGGCRDAADRPDSAAQSVASLLRALASGRLAQVCERLTQSGVAELRRDFGGSGCEQTARRTIDFVARLPRQRKALENATVLPTLDVPLAPGPARPIKGSARVRVLIHDPVLGVAQTLDLGLRRTRGRWAVQSGIAALLTVMPRRRGQHLDGGNGTRTG